MAGLRIPRGMRVVGDQFVPAPERYYRGSGTIVHVAAHTRLGRPVGASTRFITKRPSLPNQRVHYSTHRFEGFVHIGRGSTTSAGYGNRQGIGVTRISTTQASVTFGISPSRTLRYNPPTRQFLGGDWTRPRTYAATPSSVRRFNRLFNAVGGRATRGLG